MTSLGVGPRNIWKSNSSGGSPRSHGSWSEFNLHGVAVFEEHCRTFTRFFHHHEEWVVAVQVGVELNFIISGEHSPNLPHRKIVFERGSLKLSESVQVCGCQGQWHRQVLIFIYHLAKVHC